MSTLDIWDLIKQNKYEEACQQADVQYNQTENIFPLRNKIYALLNLEKFRECINLCEQLISLRNGETESDFVFAGVSYWLLDDKEMAIQMWKKSQEAKYKDASGGIEVQLLILFAGLKIQDSNLITYAKAQIKKLLKSKRANSWPGPIGRYMLGDCKKEDLLAIVSDVGNIRGRQLCQVNFASALKELERGNLILYNNEIKACLKFTPSSYLVPFYYISKSETKLNYQ